MYDVEEEQEEIVHTQHALFFLMLKKVTFQHLICSPLNV